MNRGEDLAGNSIGGTTDFLIGCAFNPTARDLPLEKERLAQKLEAGAHFVMTQPVYDLELVDRTLEHISEFHANVILGILPLQSYKHAEFLHNEVPGIVIPEFVLAKMYEAGANGKQAGVEMAQEILNVCARQVRGRVPDAVVRALRDVRQRAGRAAEVSGGGDLGLVPKLRLWN